MKNKKIISIFILIILMIFFVTFFSCITSIEKLNEKTDSFNGKVLRIKGTVKRIYFFKDTKYYLYEIDNENFKAYLLATKSLKRFQKLDFNGKVYYLPETIDNDFEKKIKNEIDTYLVKMTTIEEKVVFLHSLKIIDLLKKLSKENKGIVLILAYNFN